MKELFMEKSFRRDLKIADKRNLKLNKLDIAVDLLINDKPLPHNFYPHKLVGKWTGLWECHINPDLLLIYDFDEENVRLIRLATHSDLF